MEVDKNTLSNDEKPLVTIWIAARNEEGILLNVLSRFMRQISQKSIASLNWR
jgi:hypothetical protein